MGVGFVKSSVCESSVEEVLGDVTSLKNANVKHMKMKYWQALIYLNVISPLMRQMKYPRLLSSGCEAALRFS